MISIVTIALGISLALNLVIGTYAYFAAKDENQRRDATHKFPRR